MRPACHAPARRGANLAKTGGNREAAIRVESNTAPHLVPCGAAGIAVATHLGDCSEPWPCPSSSHKPHTHKALKHYITATAREWGPALGRPASRERERRASSNRAASASSQEVPPYATPEPNPPSGSSVAAMRAPSQARGTHAAKPRAGHARVRVPRCAHHRCAACVCNAELRRRLKTKSDVPDGCTCS